MNFWKRLMGRRDAAAARRAEEARNETPAERPDGVQIDLPRLSKPYHQDQLRERLDQILG